MYIKHMGSYMEAFPHGDSTECGVYGRAEIN